MHTSSGAINLVSDSHASRYNFGTLEGTLRSVPKYRPTVGAGSGDRSPARVSAAKVYEVIKRQHHR